MIAVFCPPHVRIAELAGATFMGLELVRCADWPRFHRARALAQCAILVIPRLTQAIVRDLQAVGSRTVLAPTVLVTDKDPEALRWIAGAPVQEVVWLGHANGELHGAVQRARTGAFLAGVAERIAAAHHLPPRLREALAYACRAPAPVQLVAALARAVGCSRGTLARQWKQAVRPGCPLRLEDVLDHLLLLRSAARRTPGRGWASIAQELGVQERTLRRVARRVAGLRLGMIDVSTHPELAFAFETRVLRAIIAIDANCPE